MYHWLFGCWLMAGSLLFVCVDAESCATSCEIERQRQQQLEADNRFSLFFFFFLSYVESHHKIKKREGERKSSSSSSSKKSRKRLCSVHSTQHTPLCYAAVVTCIKKRVQGSAAAAAAIRRRRVYTNKTPAAILSFSLSPPSFFPFFLPFVVV